MQTRSTHFMHSERHFVRALAGALVGCLLLSSAGCAAPQLTARVEESRAANPCVRAYRSASSAQAMMAGHNPRLLRFLASVASGSQWTEVAAACPQRFAEGTIRAAQTQHLAHVLAPFVGGSYADPAATAHRGGPDDIARLQASADALLAAVLAEDRAGFAVEVLAARGVSNATLMLSDDHKATASRLFSLASAVSEASPDADGATRIKDPRQKVYSVKQLLANHNTIIDQSTGLRVPTLAAVEIDCAREEIAGASGQSSDATHVDGLRTLSRLASSRVEQALNYGYPSFDDALFS